MYYWYVYLLMIMDGYNILITVYFCIHTILSTVYFCKQYTLNQLYTFVDMLYFCRQLIFDECAQNNTHKIWSPNIDLIQRRVT